MPTDSNSVTMPIMRGLELICLGFTGKGNNIFITRVSKMTMM